MKTFYATVIDINYVVRALCLYRSFEPFLDNKIFAFYCVDESSHEILDSLRLRNAWVIAPKDFETDALKAIRPYRAMNEYCWTCKPVALQHAMAANPAIEWAVYLDSDMMAFSDPDAGLLVESGAQVVITPHRYATRAFGAHEQLTGSYNGGYVAYRNSVEGRQALQWWMERCLELCPNVPVSGAYADQKYLDDLPELFKGVHRSPHKGMNSAPWNIEAYRVTSRDGRVYVDDDELLIYHFQGLRIYGTRLYELYAGRLKIPGDAARHIYRPYLRNLRQSYGILRSCKPGFSHGVDPFLAKPKRMLTQTKRLMLGINNLAVV